MEGFEYTRGLKPVELKLRYRNKKSALYFGLKKKEC